MRASRNPGTSCRARPAEPVPACRRKPERPELGCRTPNRLVVSVINCEERFCGTGFMSVAGITREEIVHGRIATVERLPIVLFRNRFFVPGGKAHNCLRIGFDIRAMAARSLAFCAGGFSSRFSTNRLSRSDRIFGNARRRTGSRSS